ncbi:YbaK/EbsC family protein [Williamsia sp. MIQD14]|uniref:YbaK/EbsC family protein n=1 Tax=Williamsia sp. MIQD14 TaxID=3425703 RepID=UPI003DA15285
MTVTVPGAELLGADDFVGRLEPAVERDVVRTGSRAFVVDPDSSDTDEFARRYHVPLSCCANCLVTASGKGENRRYAMALVPATLRLVTKVIQREMGGKTSFARPEAAAAVTGMEFGAITPMGRPADVPVFIADELLAQEWVIVGGGVRDVKIAVSPRAIVEHLGARILPGLAVSPADSAT